MRKSVRAFVEDRPTATFWVFAGVHGAVSTLAPALGFSNLPLDVVEGLAWSRSLEFGFHKHPAGAAAVLALIDRFGGGNYWLVYAASQAAVVATFWAVYMLARSIVGSTAAVLSTVMLAGVHYYSIASASFNPDVVLSPLWAWFALSVWRAVGEGRKGWWIVVGLTLGLMVHAKYTGALLAVSVALWLVSCEKRGEVLTSPFPWLAVLGATAIAAPHLYWIHIHHYETLKYVSFDRSPVTSWGQSVLVTINFVLAQVGQHAGFIAIALAAALPLSRCRPAMPVWRIKVTPVQPLAHRFVLAVAFGPLAIAVLAQALANFQFRQMWGAPFFAFSGLALVVLLRDRLMLRNMPFPFVVAIIMIIGPPIGNVLQYQFPSLLVPNGRMIYPSEVVAARMLELYRHETGQDPRIVVAGVWDGGAIALHASGRPLVMINGDPRSTSGVTSELLSRRGALVVWRAKDGEAPEALLNHAKSASRHDPTVWTRPILAKLKPFGRESFEHRDAGKSGQPPIQLYWAILSAEGALSGNPPDKRAYFETLGTVMPPIFGRLE